MTDRRRLAVFLALVTATTGFSVPAAPLGTSNHQRMAAPSPLLGTWDLDWEIGRTIMNGATGTINAHGTLVVTTSAGDSLEARVTMRSRDDGGTIRPPYTMRGVATETGGIFIHEPKATTSINGAEQQQVVTSTWTLRVQGDTVTGSAAREVPGIVRGTMVSAVRGTRSRS